MSNYYTAVLLFIAFILPLASHAADQIPVAAPMTTSLAGAKADTAVPTVYRVQVPSTNKSGSAFLHRSGWVITAAHVIEGAQQGEIRLIDCLGKIYQVTKSTSDSELDIAILTTEKPIAQTALELASTDPLTIGMQVSTWGFPGGYYGFRPLLMTGYLSGEDIEYTKNKKKVVRWVINAAFNNGNSGGPVIDIESGKVIGIVSSKIAPLPLDIQMAMLALKNQKASFMYQGIGANGKPFTFSEGQVVEMVLEHLRNQTQLVIGRAVTTLDLIAFLKSNGIEP